MQMWVFTLVWTTFVAFMWRDARHDGLEMIIQTCLTLVTPVLATKAMLQTWGKYTVTGSPDGIHMFTGIGSLGWTRQYAWKDLCEIRLRTSYGRRGSQRKWVVVEAGHSFGFGEELSDDQRHFLAQLLLSKRNSNRS